MTQPYYVSPEQIMKDRADFARKGIARGRSVVVLSSGEGLALVAQNASPSLNKIGEIYDRIAFAAVGKYNEFESLRQAGVRYADVRGYSYDRQDVTARGLASVYAESLGTVFTAEQKPFEVELAVAEVGESQEQDHIFRLSFDGSISDERRFVVMGGLSEKVGAILDRDWQPGLSLRDAFRLGIRALGSAGDDVHDGGEQPASSAHAVQGLLGLEAAALYRDPSRWRAGRRAFHRFAPVQLSDLLQDTAH